jgi:hypothetical protein
MKKSAQLGSSAPCQAMSPLLHLLDGGPRQLGTSTIDVGIMPYPVDTVSTSLLPRKLGCQPPTSSGARQKLGCSCPVSAIAIGADRLFSNRPASMLQWRSPLKKRGWLWCKSRIAMNQSSHSNAALPIMRTSQSQELSRAAGRLTTQQPLDDGMGTGDHGDHSPKGTALLGDLFLRSSHPFPQISHVCTLRYFIDGTARPISGALGVTSNLEP